MERIDYIISYECECEIRLVVSNSVIPWTLLSMEFSR